MPYRVYGVLRVIVPFVNAEKYNLTVTTLTYYTIDDAGTIESHSLMDSIDSILSIGYEFMIEINDDKSAGKYFVLTGKVTRK